MDWPQGRETGVSRPFRTERTVPPAAAGRTTLDVAMDE